LMCPYLEQVFGQLEAAKQRAKGLSILDAAELRLGMMCTLGPARLMGLMEAYRRAHPGVSLDLHDATGKTLRGLLDTGDLDVAIFAIPEIEDHFHVMPLFTEPFVIAIGPGHRLEQKDALSVTDLDGESYLRRTNCEFGDHFHGILTEREVEPVCIYRSEREDWIQVMARAGLGFAIIPQFSLTVDGLLTRPLVDPPLARTVNVVTVRGRPHSPAVGAFVHDAMRHKWPA